MRARIVSACLLVCLALPARADAADPDPWLGKDKALHFGVSSVIAAGSYTAGTIVFDARCHALLAAGGFTLAVGAGKELLDLAGYGDPSWKDFLADVVGTVAGLAVAWSIDLLIRGVGDEHPLFRAPHPAAPRAIASPFVLSF